MNDNNISRNWGVNLTKLIKEAGQSSGYRTIGANIGRVVSRNPLGISLYDSRVFVYSDIHSLYITEDLKEKGIKNNDRVLVIADNDNQEFFIVDILEKV